MAFSLQVFLKMVDQLSGPIQRPMAALQALERQAHRVELGTQHMLDGAAVTAAGAAITAPLVKATMAASDLNETVNKSTVVFGKNQAVITAWARNSASDMNLSRQAAIESAATLGNLFTSMKIDSGSAATMSTRLVTLAGDLSSFHNVPVQEAFDAIRSGLVGETEPLRRFGATIDDQRLKLKAFQMGLTKKVKVDTLPAAVKAAAVNALIFEDTKNAQGDQARTAQALANTTRRLGAQMGDTWATIGQHTLPIATALMNRVSGLLARFNRFAEAHPTVTKGLVLIAGGIGGVLIVGGSLLVMLGALNVLWGSAGSGLVLLQKGLAGTSTWLNVTAGGYYRNLVAVGAWTSANSTAHWMNLQQVGGLAALRLALVGARVSLIGAATSAWAFTAALLANPVTWVVVGVVALVGALWLLWKTFPQIGQAAKRAWSGLLYGLGYVVGVIQATFQSFMKNPIRFLVQLQLTMLRLGVQLVMGLVRGIGNGAKAVWKAITGVAQGALDRFKSFFGIRSPSRVFSGLGEDMLNGLSGGMERRAPAVFRFLTDRLGPKMLGALQGGWSRVRAFGGGLLDRAKGALGIGGAGPAAANTTATAARFNLSGIAGEGTGAKLARAAVQGITAGWAESIPGYCSRFVRQVFQKTLGPQTAKLFGSSAINTERIWKSQGLTKTLAEMGGKAALKAGDVLFQGFGSGGMGHIAQYLGNGKIAHNTTANGGGKMVSDLSSFGAITSVGRLPSTPPPLPRVAAPRAPAVPAPPRPQGQASPQAQRPIHIANLSLPNVTKPDEFVAGLRLAVESHQ